MKIKTYIVMVHTVSKSEAWRYRGLFNPDPKEAKYGPVLAVHHTADRKEAIRVHDLLIAEAGLDRWSVSVVLRHYAFANGAWYQVLPESVSNDENLFNKPFETQFSYFVERALGSPKKEPPPESTKEESV